MMLATNTKKPHQQPSSPSDEKQEQQEHRGAYKYGSGEKDNHKNNNNNNGEPELEFHILGQQQQQQQQEQVPNNNNINGSSSGSNPDDSSTNLDSSSSQPSQSHIQKDASLQGEAERNNQNYIMVMDEQQPGIGPTAVPFDRRRRGPEIPHPYAEFAYCRGCERQFTRPANATGATYFRCERCRDSWSIIEGSCCVL